MIRKYVNILVFLFFGLFSINSFSQCGLDSTEIVITITTDNYPGETYWQLVDQNGSGYAINSGDLTLTNTTYVWNICVPDINCYTFTIFDTWGDGICCVYGNGSYNISYAGSVIATGGSFGSFESTPSIGSCSPSSSTCGLDSTEIVISITTDNYPGETYWQLVDQNGSGFYINPGDLTQSNTTYTWSICVPDINCYQFTIYDTYGDGLCCFWGSGSYSVTYAGGTVANGASFLSSETTYGIGSCSPVSNCPAGEVEILITVSTDDYPTETSWFLMNQMGGGWTNVPLATSDANTTLTWSICVPDTNCYTFTMLDSYGDGICCAWGNGSYTISYNGVQQGSGSSFTFAEEICNIGSCSPNCQITIPSNAIPEGEPCGTDANHGCDDNWEISNFTITGVTDIWAFGGVVAPNPFGGYFDVGDTPDLYVYMRKNNEFFYYSDYYLDTWYPNNGYGFSSQPLSFSMYPNVNGTTLEVPTQGLYTSPYVSGQNFNYDFLVGDDDAGSFLNVFGANDFLGSYNLPSFTNASTFSITTSGGTSGDAYVNYTTVAPINVYTPLTNNNIVHGTFWGENNVRDTDWYEFTLSDSSEFSLKAISETPFQVRLMDANGGCSNVVALDSASAFQCDTLMINRNLQPGTYWLLVIPNYYSCMSCSDSIEYLLDVEWNEMCDLSISASITNSDCLGSNGSINLSVTGGTSPFNYLWNSGDTTQDITGQVGVYDVVVTDDRGCIDTLNNVVINAGTPVHDFSTGAYVFGFEPTEDFSGWLIEDANADGFSWGVNQYTGNNNTYGAIYNYNSNGITSADDWLHSQCFVLDTIGTYLLSFKHRVASSNFPENMAIYIGDQQHSSSMNTQLLQLNGMTNVVYDSTAILFSVPSPGVYYIAWHAYSDANMWRIDLDDINLASFIYTTGCTDSTALNYNPLATIDDGSCILPVYGCTDSTALNFNPLATVNDGSCISVVYGCTDSTALNYYAGATVDDGSCLYTLFGCTDSAAINYDPLVLIDDGSCIYPIFGCTDTIALNYDSTANTDDGSCVYGVYGCTDSTALNFYPGATIDDGSCIYPVLGCTDPCNICNYNPLANIDDGSCIYSTGCLSTGCTDLLALNYDSTACVDDSSCIYCVYGCMDYIALNYDSLATCDDGSCQYITCGPITGVYVDNVIHDRATFNWDNMNSSTCQVDQIRIRYREVGASSWLIKTMGSPVGSGCNTINTSKLILDLNPSTTYEYDLKIWYCNGVTVNWHAGGIFTTEEICQNVTNLSITPINTTKTEFCWDSVSSYSFVRLRYRVDTAGSSFSNIGGFGVYYPDLCKQKNGLSAGINYRLFYRTWCDSLGGAFRSDSWDGPLLWTQPSSIRIGNPQHNQDIILYPNPSRGIFYIKFPFESESFDVCVYNVLGELVIKDTYKSSLQQFDLSDYPKGIYTVQVRSRLQSKRMQISLQ